MLAFRQEATAETRSTFRQRDLVGGVSVVWHLVGWLAFALNVWGNVMLTTKSKSGWIVRLVCNLCWLPYAALTGAWALFANHVVFIGVNVLGWIRWSREEDAFEKQRSA